MKKTTAVSSKKKQKTRPRGRSGPPMSLAKARRVIRDDSANYTEWWLASAVLCFNKGSSIDDLLACLKRSSAARWGAKGLHRRTRRPCKDMHWITDLEDWQHYLKAKGYL
jgi:hypothetical protein